MSGPTRCDCIHCDKFRKRHPAPGLTIETTNALEKLHVVRTERGKRRRAAKGLSIEESD